MPTIDSENAKQIRQPMDVLITMSLADDDITMTYSGYSSAKVADGKLDERSWSMRKLADLQGDGFPLDGSCVLYNSATQPSQANGKLGVRSNVGQSVTVTATGSKVMPSLTVLVTGAASVTYNGTTTDITGNQVNIPVLSTSITMTFAPASQTERIEISAIFPDQEFRITNDNLIRATVSLRSDLSLFNQTLPESEINIEVYHNADIAEEVANIPADTPIVYQAGYPGDMSPARTFYVSGQVTWADNVLSIHGVDAVHFLDDFEVGAPIYLTNTAPLQGLLEYMIARTGVDFDGIVRLPSSSAYKNTVVPKGIGYRDFLAFLNQTLNITDDQANLIDGSGTLYRPCMFSYIDAGRPRLRTVNYWGLDRELTIREDDCADVKKIIDRDIAAISATWERLSGTFGGAYDDNVQIGTASLLKDVGTSISFDKYAAGWVIGLYLGANIDNDIATKMLNKYGVVYGLGKCMPVVPTQSDGGYQSFAVRNRPTAPNGETYSAGDFLTAPEIIQDDFYVDKSSPKAYSQFIPWTQQYDNFRYDNNPSHLITTAQQMWTVLVNAKVIDANEKSVDLVVYGSAIEAISELITFSKEDGQQTYVYPSQLCIQGTLDMSNRGGTSKIDVYPTRMLASPLYRSPITGSFTWKGDPRMQPRDVVKWTRLDGTTEEITLENITLAHEGGGTSAEITYRKGVI